MSNQYQEVFLTTYGLELKDLAYFAGLFDGEGWVHAQIAGRKTSVGLALANTNRTVLEWVKQRFGGRIYDKPSKKYKHKLWQWQMTGKRTLPLLKALEPILKIKGNELRIAIEMLEYIHPRGGNVIEPQHYFDFLQGKALQIHKLKDAYKVPVN